MMYASKDWFETKVKDYIVQKVERSIFSIGLDQLFELFDQLLVFLPLGLIERFVIVAVRRRFQMVRKAGYYPMMYASKDWFETKVYDKELAEYDHWVAQYAGKKVSR